jgi:hypothetical protein
MYYIGKTRTVYNSLVEKSQWKRVLGIGRHGWDGKGKVKVALVFN